MAVVAGGAPAPAPALASLARSLRLGCVAELRLTPKPGLVDQRDNGAHADLTYFLMRRSTRLVGDYLDDIVLSLQRGEPFAAQVAIGRAAENRMFERFGTNTHKGYIFIAGIALMARHHHPAAPLDEGIRRVAAGMFSTEREPASHGARLRQAEPKTGIRHEALAGFPAVFHGALPRFREFTFRFGPRAGLFALLGSLMCDVHDSTTLRRAGEAGLARLRRDGAGLLDCLRQGRAAEPFLIDCNNHYRRCNMTMGGVADLLALAVACVLEEGHCSADDLNKAIANR